MKTFNIKTHYFFPDIIPVADDKRLCFDNTWKVMKRGKESDLTTGVLHKIEPTVRISFPESRRYYEFRNCYSIQDETFDKTFFRLGDSGSGVFILDNNDQSIAALGIAFARGVRGHVTYVCKIKDISDEFNLSIYQDGPIRDLFNNNAQKKDKQQLQQANDQEEPMDTS